VETSKAHGYVMT